VARWLGVRVLGLNAIDQMFFLPGYPFWSLIIIAARHGADKAPANRSIGPVASA
jgi:hypothetical protein